MCAVLFIALAGSLHVAQATQPAQPAASSVQPAPPASPVAAAAEGTFRAAVNGSAEVPAQQDAQQKAGQGAPVPEPATGSAGSVASDMTVNTTTPGDTQTAPLPSSGWGNYFQAIGILLLILGGLYMGIWALKRFGKLTALGGRLARSGVAVEGQFHLGPKKSLVVVRFLNKRLLLGVTDHQINLLTEMEAEHDPTNESSASDFKAILEDADKQNSSS